MRNAVAAFVRSGLAALTPGKGGPKHPRVKLDAATQERLRALLHQSPRRFGKPTGVWKLELAARGITAERVSDETVRTALKRLRVGWRQAKRWVTSPDPEYARKKALRPSDVLGGEPPGRDLVDSADPAGAHIWTVPGRPRRSPKALACYGLLCPDTDTVWLRFVTGRPVSALTTRFLAWCAGGKTALVVWDNASWRLSQHFWGWLRTHNRRVKQTGQGVRIIACPLPTKSPTGSMPSARLPSRIACCRPTN